MNRAVACGLALCLCWSAQEVSAQGLLGKPYVSAQYQTLHVGHDFDAFDTKMGNGGRVQGNFPLATSDAETAWGGGIDLFGAFSGIGFGLRDPSVPDLKINAALLGGDVGFSFYTRATENIRPFAQLGVNWSQTRVSASAPGFSVNENDSDNNLILTAGVEVDVVPSLALRASYGRGADGFGSTGFLGEAIVRPGDNWFGRFSVACDKDTNVIGGFGLGYAW